MDTSGSDVAEGVDNHGDSTITRVAAIMVKRHKLKQTVPLLHTLREMRPSRRSVVLEHLDDRGCGCVSEAIGEVLKGKHLTPEFRAGAREALMPYKRDLRFLADSSKTVQARRKRLLHLNESALDAILSVTIPLLLHIIDAHR